MKNVYVIMDKGSMDYEVCFPTRKQAEVAAKLLYHDAVMSGDRTKVVEIPFIDIQKELK